MRQLRAASISDCVSVCITRHYICHPLQGHWGKSVQVKISDVIQLSRRSTLVSFPWFLRKYHRTIPVSTAACERGFSKMNIICSPVRTRLTVKHTSSLTFVSLSIPPVMLFEPLKYVKSWLVLNRRSAVNSQGPSRKQEVVGTSEMKSLWKMCYVYFSGFLSFMACKLISFIALVLMSLICINDPFTL